MEQRALWRLAGLWRRNSGEQGGERRPPHLQALEECLTSRSYITGGGGHPEITDHYFNLTFVMKQDCRSHSLDTFSTENLHFHTTRWQ